METYTAPGRALDRAHVQLGIRQSRPRAASGSSARVRREPATRPRARQPDGASFLEIAHGSQCPPTAAPGVDPVSPAGRTARDLRAWEPESVSIEDAGGVASGEPAPAPGGLAAPERGAPPGPPATGRGATGRPPCRAARGSEIHPVQTGDRPGTEPRIVSVPRTAAE